MPDGALFAASRTELIERARIKLHRANDTERAGLMRRVLLGEAADLPALSDDADGGDITALMTAIEAAE